MNAPRKKPEKTVLGDLEVLQELGRGGMATLYLARRVGLHGFAREVAVKVIHPNLADDPAFTQMFINEARLAAQVRHPNVVAVEDFGDADGVLYLVMEYVDGCSIRQMLTRMGSNLEPRLSIDEVVHLVAQTARGLNAAHTAKDAEGVPLRLVHRDVSPHNVLLSTEGEVKLCDFGIAKPAGQNTSSDGSLKGKFAYMSPEQAEGRSVDSTSDLYSLGVILWELLAFKRLFRGPTEVDTLSNVRDPKVPNIRDANPEVSMQLAEVVTKALAKEPSARFASGREMRDALLNAQPSARAVDPNAIGARVTQYGSGIHPAPKPLAKPIRIPTAASLNLAGLASGQGLRTTPLRRPSPNAPSRARGPSTPPPPPRASAIAPRAERADAMSLAPTLRALGSGPPSSSGLATTPLPLGARSEAPSSPAFRTGGENREEQGATTLMESPWDPKPQVTISETAVPTTPGYERKRRKSWPVFLLLVFVVGAAGAGWYVATNIDNVPTQSLADTQSNRTSPVLAAPAEETVEPIADPVPIPEVEVTVPVAPPAAEVAEVRRIGAPEEEGDAESWAEEQRRMERERRGPRVRPVRPRPQLPAPTASVPITPVQPAVTRPVAAPVAPSPAMDTSPLMVYQVNFGM